MRPAGAVPGALARHRGSARPAAVTLQLEFEVGAVAESPVVRATVRPPAGAVSLPRTGRPLAGASALVAGTLALLAVGALGRTDTAVYAAHSGPPQRA